MIVTAGKALVAGLMTGTFGNNIAFIGIGSGSTAPAAGDTNLETAIQLSSATISRATTTTTDDTVVFANTFTAASSQTVREAVLRTAAFGTPAILSRVATATYSMGGGDRLTITWNIKVA